MRKISCEIVANSMDSRGNRITSAIFQFPRYILAELNTHRVLSKNSASSRAIPFKKMLKSVMEDPFIPIKWMKDHSGMQGSEYFNERGSEVCQSAWLVARNKAVEQASYLNEYGLTKQFANRLLEPFLWHRVLITGTEWDNFFALRAHEDADIHIAKLAEEALLAFNNSTPKLLNPGEWHIPFVGDLFHNDDFYKFFRDTNIIEWRTAEGHDEALTDMIVRIAIARCARVSYDNFDGTQDYGKDLELFNRLFARNPIHASPAEHVACCLSDNEYNNLISMDKARYDDTGKIVGDYHKGWSRNFRGFKQYRTLLTNDTIFNDSRLIKHG